MITEVAVRKEIEITVRVQNEPGVLARLFATAASCGNEILACNSYSNGKWAVVLLVTDNPDRTERALQDEGFEYGADSVVLVSAPESLACTILLTAKLRAAGIGILYSYMSWFEPHNVRAVFKTQDDALAMRVLERFLADASRDDPGNDVAAPTVPAGLNRRAA